MTSWKSQDDYYTTICSARTLQSDKKGFFQNYADHVTETAGQEWVRKFGKLQSNEERIKKCFYDDKIFEAVHGPLQNTQSLFRNKCAQIAQQRRLEGQQMVNKGILEKALQLFSQSIIRTPPTGFDTNIDEGLTLALSLWDRSAVLISLDEYQLALADIQFSMKENLPETNSFSGKSSSAKYVWSEAFFRMAQCYIGLKERNKAIVSLNIVSKLVGNDFDWNKKIEQLLNKAKQIVEEPKKEDSKCVPQVTDGPNPTLTSASKLVALKSSKEAGRYVVANQDIKAGDTLVVEKPYIAALLPNKFSTHCLHCLKRLRAPIPCRECSGVAFCSMSCHDIAWKTYHRYECKYLDMLLGSGMSILCHMSLRIFTATSLDYFLQLKPKLGKDSTSHPYLKFYSLETHKESRCATDFLHRTLMSLFLLRILQCTGYFGPQFDKEKLTDDEVFVGGLLLHHLQLLQFSAHEIYETLMKAPDDLQSTKLVYMAVGIYPSVAMFNHNCYPVVTRYFNGSTIIIKAVRPLKPGEEVSENYGPIFTKMSLPERQRSLQSRYWFKCNCIPCCQNWPKYEDSNEPVWKLRCSNKDCTEGIVINLQNIPKKAVNCTKCNSIIQVQEISLLLKSYIEDYNNALYLMKEGKLEKAEELLCHFSNTMHSICYPPSKDLNLCEEAMRSCWAMKDTHVYFILK